MRTSHSTQPGSDTSLFSRTSTVYVGKDPKATTSFSLDEASWMPKGWKLAFTGIATFDAAQAMKGQQVYLDREALAPAAPNEYLVQDLVGCVVFDSVLGKVGVLESVEPAPVPGIGSDLWWIKTPSGELVGVPAVKRFVNAVKIADRKIEVVDFGELA